MSSFILRPIPLSAGAFSVNAPVAEFPVGNLASPQPKEVWALPHLPYAWAASIIVDLGSDRQLDTFAMLFHNGNGDGYWTVNGRTAAQGPFPAHFDTAGSTLLFAGAAWRDDPAEGATRFHALRLLAAPVTARYLMLFPGSSTANNPYFRAGVLAVGKRWQPADPHDWGSGRRIGDLSDVRVMDGGERGIWRKARVPEVRFSYSQISETELQTLYEMLLQAGESGPILFGENWTGTGTGQQERIHYGTLAGLDFYERRQTDKSRIDLRLRHWL